MQEVIGEHHLKHKDMPEYLRKKGKYLGTLERETSRGNETHHASHSHDEKFLKEKWAEAKKKLRHLEMMTMMMKNLFHMICLVLY